MTVLDVEAEDKESSVATDNTIPWKPTPIEVVHPEHVSPSNIVLLREPTWKLRMTIEGDRSYIRVKVARAAPLTEPDRYICLLDIKDESICVVKEMEEFSEANQIIVREELDKRYLTSYIERINHLKNEYGVSYWDVDTDRGHREFVAKNIAENAQWLGEGRLFLLDVDGNRFEIRNIQSLDKRSRGFVDLVL